MERLLNAIVADDLAGVKRLLARDGAVATSRTGRAKLYDSEIFHWLYTGDTALHLAAAGYRVEIARVLLKAGADPNAAGTHRLGTPLHYAADGYVSGPAWDAARQVKTLRLLLGAGAQINAADKNGATALHRAVRTRCADAVRVLLEAGGDPKRKNLSGSTPFHLAVQNTGHGGSGSKPALAGQRAIIETFRSLGVSTSMKDGRGKTVIECAKSEWIKEMLKA